MENAVDVNSNEDFCKYIKSDHSLRERGDKFGQGRHAFLVVIDLHLLEI